MKDENGKIVRKTLTKKEVMKLKSGSLIRVAWLDGPDTIHLVRGKPRNEGRGTVSIATWSPILKGRDIRFVESDQVVEYLGSIDALTAGYESVDALMTYSTSQGLLTKVRLH